jgi:cytochrome c oxidase assembly factor CtaG
LSVREALRPQSLNPAAGEYPYTESSLRWDLVPGRQIQLCRVVMVMSVRHPLVIIIVVLFIKEIGIERFFKRFGQLLPIQF